MGKIQKLTQTGSRERKLTPFKVSNLEIPVE
jgi:hypothetical protein